jgi:glycosyltransferase involved in cell wall biosynthesis
VDFTRFRSATAQDYRRRLGFGDDDIVFFSPRSFTQPYYNIDTVIEAAARVVATVPGARFFFAGYEGDPGPFRARAEAAGLTGVMVFGGRIPHAEFASALNASDVFISVPSVDATAVSLLEAMACQCAIIVSDLPSATEWIADGKSGLVVTPRDVTGLADAMKRFAGNPELRAVCGRAAGETARRDAGFDANMSHVADIFRCLTEDEVDWPVEVSLPLLSGG